MRKVIGTSADRDHEGEYDAAEYFRVYRRGLDDWRSIRDVIKGSMHAASTQSHCAVRLIVLRRAEMIEISRQSI